MRYRHINKPPQRRTHVYVTTSVTLIAALMLAFKLVETDVIWIVVVSTLATLAILILEEATFLRRPS